MTNWKSQDVYNVKSNNNNNKKQKLFQFLHSFCLFSIKAEKKTNNFNKKKRKKEEIKSDKTQCVVKVIRNLYSMILQIHSSDYLIPFLLFIL